MDRTALRDMLLEASREWGLGNTAPIELIVSVLEESIEMSKRNANIPAALNMAGRWVLRLQTERDPDADREADLPLPTVPGSAEPGEAQPRSA